MPRATLRIVLPIESPEPIELDDLMALWNDMLRTVYACGFSAEGARVDYEGLER